MIRFSAEQEEFRKAVARFVDGEVAPAAEAIDERGEFPAKLFKRLGELGYLGLRYPEKYGGADADMVTYCLFAEELARGSLSVAAVAAMQSLMGTYFVYKYGSEALRARYLVPALRGELIATFGLTEPNAGSDVAAITTRAQRRGDRYVLRGTKTWVTSAPVADILTVAAKTSDERGMKSIALFLLDRATMRGITLGKSIEKMAVRGSVTGEILLEDVEVPAEHLLGGETGGVEKIGGILSEIRVMTAAISVGLARAAYQAGARVRARAARVRQADRRASGDRLQARRHADLAPRRDPRYLSGGGSGRRGAHRHARGRDGEALRLGDGREDHRRGGPDLRLVRARDGVSGPALLPGRALLAARGRHLRDPAPDHRSRSRLGARPGIRLTQCPRRTVAGSARRPRRAGERTLGRDDAIARTLFRGLQGGRGAGDGAGGRSKAATSRASPGSPATSTRSTPMRSSRGRRRSARASLTVS
jgi:alkylation response protein AidB-like acyl-CoA dehydrogenase